MRDNPGDYVVSIVFDGKQMPFLLAEVEEHWRQMCAGWNAWRRVEELATGTEVEMKAFFKDSDEAVKFLVHLERLIGKKATFTVMPTIH